MQENHQLIIPKEATRNQEDSKLSDVLLAELLGGFARAPNRSRVHRNHGNVGSLPCPIVLLSIAASWIPPA